MKKHAFPEDLSRCIAPSCPEEVIQEKGILDYRVIHFFLSFPFVSLFTICLACVSLRITLRYFVKGVS